RSRISPDPSFEPSSTTISSMRSGTASTRRMISSTVVRSLYTGMTTESSGSGGSDGGRGAAIGAKNGPQRLVGLAPNWLGDAVMALPALANVRRALPEARVVVAARRSVAPLFTMVPGLEDVVTLADRRSSVATLAAGGHDAALLFPNSFHA